MKMFLSKADMNKAESSQSVQSTFTLHFMTGSVSLRPPRCRRAALPRHPGPAGAGEQAAVLPPDAAWHGAPSSAVQRVCGPPCQGRPPGGSFTALPAKQGAAEHENALVGLRAS